MVGAVAFGLGVLAATAGLAAIGTPFPPVVLRYAMTLPDSAALVDHNGSGLAYAPDGSVFAYTSRLGLMLRAADRLDAVPVAGARRAVSPFFSPDGRWLGFMDGARVMKVPLAGGAPVTICDSCTGYSFSWGSDDTVRYHTAPAGEPNSRVLMAVSARGGTPYEIARPDSELDRGLPRGRCSCRGPAPCCSRSSPGRAAASRRWISTPMPSPDSISPDSVRSGSRPDS